MGTLTHVVVTPETRAVVSVGVRFGLFGHAVYLPIAQVAEATEHLVQLDLTRDEVVKYGKQPAGLRLGGDTPVTLEGKRLGKLKQATFNRDTGALRHLVIERGLGSEVVVSAVAIARLDASGVALTALGAGGRPTLTPYRPDDELRDDARRAIENYARMRVELDGINVTAIDGVVWLRGHVSSELNGRLAQDLVSGVPGIAELHNNLIADPDLAGAISRALARDPRTAEEHIGVYPMLGRVRLRGAVRTQAARDAADAIANATPGVGEVLNELRVDVNANVLPVLAGVTGDEDVVPGGR